MALADLDDVEGFDRNGEEGLLYAFQLSEGVYKRKKQGSLKMVSEFPPAGIIGLGLSVSTILLEIVLGDRPDDLSMYYRA